MIQTEKTGHAVLLAILLPVLASCLTEDPHIVSAIIQAQTGITMRDWAREVLFDKIGISRLEWITYKDGITMGAFGIETTPRELGKIGQLVLNEGLWGSERIVSKAWLDEMTSAQVPAAETQVTDSAFCYLWWKDVARNVSFSWGHGGQYMFINREKDLIVVITSEPRTNGQFVLSVYQGLAIYDRINRITAR